ncbi:rhodanese domain-containing protein, partial [Haematococcus lacustris]
LGPELLLGPEQAPVQALTAKLALAWGNASVLVQHQRKMQIYNPCLIPADFKLFIEGSDSAFSVEPREAHLEPGCSMTATVTVCMDDTRAFTDNLHLLVSEGADISIPLDATGTGNTLVAADIEHDQLDFKHQFLGRAFQRRILVSNLGCKTQSLVWINTEMDRVRLQYAKIARSAGKKFSMDLVPLEVQPVFSITPEKASLPAKESVAFLINGFSHRVGDISEQFVCMASVGGNSKQERTAFNFAAKVLVVTPL